MRKYRPGEDAVELKQQLLAQEIEPDETEEVAAEPAASEVTGEETEVDEGTEVAAVRRS